MSPTVQNLIATGIGLIALGYLIKRWWPSWKALFKPSSAGASCGAPAHTASTCGSGCGQCGSSSAATKEHRIQITKRHP